SVARPRVLSRTIPSKTHTAPSPPPLTAFTIISVSIGSLTIWTRLADLPLTSALVLSLTGTPPLTGGRMATSSPSLRTCSGPAYSWLTATAAVRIAASLNVPFATRTRTRSDTRPSPLSSTHAPSGGRAVFRGPNDSRRTRMDKAYGTLQTVGRVPVRVRYTRQRIRGRDGGRAHGTFSRFQEAERDGGQSAQGFS